MASSRVIYTLLQIPRGVHRMEHTPKHLPTSASNPLTGVSSTLSSYSQSHLGPPDDLLLERLKQESARRMDGWMYCTWLDRK